VLEIDHFTCLSVVNGRKAPSSVVPERLQPPLMCIPVHLTSDVNRQAAFQARQSRSGALLAANELLAASGEMQAA
jgi:hypothetical protein